MNDTNNVGDIDGLPPKGSTPRPLPPDGEYIANVSFRGVSFGMDVDGLISTFGTPDRVEQLDPADAKQFGFPDELTKYYSRQQTYQYIEDGFDEPSISVTLLDGKVAQVHQIDEERPIMFNGHDLLNDEIDEVLLRLNEYGGGEVLAQGDDFYFPQIGVVISDDDPGARIVSFVAPAFMQRDIDDGDLSPVDIKKYLD